MEFKEWEAAGIALFGEDRLKWRFVCPSCGRVTTVHEWMDAGAPESAVAFSCVGRWQKDAGQMGEGKQPCNYAGGGLFQLNPVQVMWMDGKPMQVFAFDEGNK